LLIWDIAGQEIFSRVREKYYGGAKAAFVVYDVTRPETLKGAKVWVNDVKKFMPGDLPIVLVGNKIDLERKISNTEGQQFSEKIGARFMETSAKTGENIPEAFKSVAKMLIDKLVRHA